MTTRTPTLDATNLVWIDLEMTGLDPRANVIMQAALVVTTAELEPLVELAFDIGQPEEALAAMAPVVAQMHRRTGLTDRVRQSKVQLGEVETAFLACIGAWCPSPAILCGNSIWADRKFIELHMPRLNAYLHYRMVDVSSLKVLAQRWYGEGAVFRKAPNGQHDARVDVNHSIEELRHYHQTLFRDPKDLAARPPG